MRKRPEDFQPFDPNQPGEYSSPEFGRDPMGNRRPLTGKEQLQVIRSSRARDQSRAQVVRDMTRRRYPNG
ncbi:hypothetical protein ASE14_18385 [Agromyces sp. Root81]|uniref:hypothetical protein n=1 Tax=Agromyces sp. Root81 TaxID=1736601 RepID=UPI0007011A93|nr:hypothetical protein [Agromyces sp. Root81]KRC58545.1 hypothetical protein ASE14_18385 [Agromyces sp. Root81]